MRATRKDKIRCEMEVLSLLARQPLGSSEVAEKLGISRSAAQGRLLRLKAQGRVVPWDLAPGRDDGGGRPMVIYALASGVDAEVAR